MKITVIPAQAGTQASMMLRYIGFSVKFIVELKQVVKLNCNNGGFQIYHIKLHLDWIAAYAGMTR